MRHVIDIDSGERDATVYPNPNSYEIPLETPLYDARHLEVTSARVPVSFQQIHDRNNVFTVRIAAGAPDAGDYDITLPTRNYESTSALVTNLASAFSSAGITTIDLVEHRNVPESLKFSNTAGSYEFSFLFKTGTNGYDSADASRTTPNQVMGMPALDIDSVNSSIDLKGKLNNAVPPKSFVLCVCGLHQHAYSTTPFYTGVFMTPNIDQATGEYYATLTSRDDPVEHKFIEGPLKTIDAIKIEWFYRENNKLIPYPFHERDHAIKFTIECATNKLEALSKKVELNSFDLPAPIRVPEFDESGYAYEAYLPIVFVLIAGFILIRALSESR